MDSIGVGRGRGVCFAPLRRPGQPVDIPDYIRSINALLSESVDQTNMLDYVVKQVVFSCSSPTASGKVVDTIYDSSIKDRKFAKVSGEIFGKLVSLDVNSSKKAVLNKLQTAYEEREKMLSDCAWELINFTCLLGFFYNKAVLSNGQPVRVVAGPLVTCLGMMLGRSFSRIEVFAEQIVLNGPLLLQHAPESLRQLMIQARVLLVGPEARTSEALLYVLLAIELHAYEFKALPDHVISYYESKLTSDQISPIIRKEISKFKSAN